MIWFQNYNNFPNVAVKWTVRAYFWYLKCISCCLEMVIQLLTFARRICMPHRINGNMRANTLAEQRLHILWHTASTPTKLTPFSQNKTTTCFAKSFTILIFNIKHSTYNATGMCISLHNKFYGWMKRQMYQTLWKQTQYFWFCIILTCIENPKHFH